jgi:hypothetical protein
MTDRGGDPCDDAFSVSAVTLLDDMIINYVTLNSFASPSAIPSIN